MTQMPSSNPGVVSVKPQPNIYTFLVLLACVVLACGIAGACYLLLSPEHGYGFVEYNVKDPNTNAPLHPDGTVAKKLENGQYEPTGYGLRFSDLLFKSSQDLVTEKRLPPEAMPSQPQQGQ